MAELHILVCDPLSENGLEILREHTQVDDRSDIEAEALAQIIEHYEGIVVRGRTKVTADLLGRAKRLKIIARVGVGVDNIDLVAAQRHGLVVVNTPDATTVSVAEHTLAMILSLVRRIPQADASMKTGQWEKKSRISKELYGKVLGIIGVGRIGMAVAERARPFGLTLLGYDPIVTAAQLNKNHIEPVSLDDLYTRSDIISLHAPLNEQTRSMIDSAAIEKMHNGTLLISTARGGIIDEEALLSGLNSGRIGGAALDVFTVEPPRSTELIGHPNLIATPHIAAQTEEAQQRAAIQAAEEILRFSKGLPLRWQLG